MIQRGPRALAIGLALLMPVHGGLAARPAHVAAAHSLAAPQTLGATRQPLAPSSAAVAAVPFGPGERFQFDVRFGNLKVGSSEMQVHGIESVRGRDAWHTSFRIQGGTFFYKVDDLFESWIDTGTFESLLFITQIEEGTRERARQYEIFPERGTYIERSRRDSKEEPSVRDPLDEGSFLYFARTIPLRVGETYDFNRYFIPDRNPVRIRVVRRERLTVPAGTFNAIVLQPIIKTRGIFAEKGHAEVWMSDDSARMILQIRTRLSFGTLNLFLKSYTQAKK